MHRMKKPAILVLATLASALFIFATAGKSSSTKKVITASAATSVNTNNASNASALFSELHLGDAGLSATVFNSALEGLEKFYSKGVIKKDDIITIVN